MARNDRGSIVFVLGTVRYLLGAYSLGNVFKNNFKQFFREYLGKIPFLIFRFNSNNFHKQIFYYETYIVYKTTCYLLITIVHFLFLRKEKKEEFLRFFSFANKWQNILYSSFRLI